jgi:hypothetical protein
MVTISKELYESIHPDFRGVWERDEWPQLRGKRTALKGSLLSKLNQKCEANPTELWIENINFKIEGE